MLVLASRSPQRQAILERLRVNFTVRPADVDELEQGEPSKVALANALKKARAVGRGRGEEVLGVDTLVELDGEIYGKPSNEAAAADTLRKLSDATHTVCSGLALLIGEEERTAVAATRVTFRQLDEAMVERYLATGEWRGRAGGYAIQGQGAALVRRIDGDYENVVGLPVAALLDIWPQVLQQGM